MRSYLSFTFLFLLLTQGLMMMAQQNISGTIKGYPNKKLSLLLLRGDQKIPVDSVRTDAEGNFRFKPSWKLPEGMYLLRTHENTTIRLIIGNENVRLQSEGTDGSHAVEFIHSLENQIWYEYYLLKNEVLFKQDLLRPILQQYPESDSFYQQTTDEFNRLQNQLYNKANLIIHQHPSSLAARFIKTDLPLKLPLQLTLNQQREYLKQNFFELTDFSDTLLIRSDLLSRKLIDYLSLYQRQGMGMNEVQIEFIKALDHILQRAAIDTKVYLFVIEYFIEGFYKMGLTGVSDYLSTLPHLQGDCLDESTLLEIIRIAGPYRKIINGSAAPPLKGTDINGKSFELSKVKNKTTLIVFWSITCPHCLDMIPQLKEITKERDDIQVVSVVLSPNNSSLQTYLKDEGLTNWIHLADGKGWNSQLVDDWLVYGTPTLFVVDSNMRISSKPSGIAELRAVFQQKP